MGIVTLHPIVQKFMDTMVFAQDHKFDRIDLQLVEIGQAQYEINLLKSSEKEEVRKSFSYGLSQMEHLGLIHKFVNTDDGFKIYPQDRPYKDEDGYLYLKFNEDEKNDVA